MTKRNSGLTCKSDKLVSRPKKILLASSCDFPGNRRRQFVTYLYLLKIREDELALENDRLGFFLLILD